MNSSKMPWMIVAIAVGIAGCVGSSASSDGTPASTQEAIATDPGEARAHPAGHPGPEMLLVIALHEGGLSDAQKTAVKSALDASVTSHRAKGRAAFEALASGVRRGSIDPAAVAASAPGEVDTSATAQAIQTLHDTLDAAQRAKLVAVAKQHLEEHLGDERPHGKEGGPIAHLFEGMNLSDAQKATVKSAFEAERSAMPEPASMKEHMRAMHGEIAARLEAFASDTFDAKAFVAPPKEMSERGPADHLAHLASALAKIVPSLDAAQREALAKRLEQGPPAPPSAE